LLRSFQSLAMTWASLYMSLTSVNFNNGITMILRKPLISIIDEE
jgi:hypothetical protein